MLGRLSNFPFEFFSYGDACDGPEDDFELSVGRWVLLLRTGPQDLGCDWLLDLFLDAVATSSRNERSVSVNFLSNEEKEESVVLECLLVVSLLILLSPIIFSVHVLGDTCNCLTVSNFDCPNYSPLSVSFDWMLQITTKNYRAPLSLFLYSSLLRWSRFCSICL